MHNLFLYITWINKTPNGMRKEKKTEKDDGKIKQTEWRSQHFPTAITSFNIQPFGTHKLILFKISVSSGYSWNIISFCRFCLNTSGGLHLSTFTLLIWGAFFLLMSHTTYTYYIRLHFRDMCCNFDVTVIIWQLFVTSNFKI